MKIQPLTSNQKGIYDIILYLPPNDDIRDKDHLEFKSNDLINTISSRFEIQVENLDGFMVWYNIERYTKPVIRITKNNILKYVYWLRLGR